MSKAFDTVNHNVLLETLHTIITDTATIIHELFKSYFCGRWQLVKVNNNFNKENVGNFGVPQGTVLGPILFKIIRISGAVFHVSIQETYRNLVYLK